MDSTFWGCKKKLTYTPSVGVNFTLFNGQFPSTRMREETGIYTKGWCKFYSFSVDCTFCENEKRRKKGFSSSLTKMEILIDLGLPPRYRDSVRAITPGLPLFLYNYSTHQLHGIFEVCNLSLSLSLHIFLTKCLKIDTLKILDYMAIN